MVALTVIVSRGLGLVFDATTPETTKSGAPLPPTVIASPPAGPALLASLLSVTSFEPSANTHSVYAPA